MTKMLNTVRSTGNVRLLTIEEIQFVSAGLDQTADGIRDVAAGAAIAGGTLLAIAALPVEAPAAIVIGGTVVAGAAAGTLIGLGAAELEGGSTDSSGGLVVDVIGGHMPTASECNADPSISDYCPAPSGDGSGEMGDFTGYGGDGFGGGDQYMMDEEFY